MAENTASALYEISYLNARELLESVARKCHEKKKIQNAKFLQKKSSVKNDDKTRKSCDYGNGCISVFERNELAVAVKSASRSLRVCWSVCGETLHMMKKRNRIKNRNEECMIVNNIEGTTHGSDNVGVDKCNYNDNNDNKKNKYNNNNNNDNNISNNNNNNNNNNNTNNSNNNNINVKNTHASLKKAFPPANRSTVVKLLIGLDESVFKPAISFSFIPPSSCPRVQR